MVLEDHLQAVEEVVARHHLRRDADGVDVGALLVEAEAVGSRGEDLATRAVGDLFAEALGEAHRAHPVAEERGERRENVCTLLLLLHRLDRRCGRHEGLQLI